MKSFVLKYFFDGKMFETNIFRGMRTFRCFRLHRMVGEGLLIDLTSHLRTHHHTIDVEASVHTSVCFSQNSKGLVVFLLFATSIVPLSNHGRVTRVRGGQKSLLSYSDLSRKYFPKLSVQL